MFRKILLSIIILACTHAAIAQNRDSAMIRLIYGAALSNGKAYDWLGELCQAAPSRLSGSPGAAIAVVWAENLFKSLNVDVKKQECKVPQWVRGGYEKGFIVVKGDSKIEVPICALGGSIPTPREGLTAPVIEVKNFEMLDAFAKQGLISGKIVFFNAAMDPKFINTFEAYGKAVNYRWSGAMKAAQYGAVGVVVRSMTLALDDFPHTGSMGYSDTIEKIPACAISTLAAEKLSSMRRSNPNIKFSFTLTCNTLPDETSYNVIGEIKGTDFPDEIITVGGHLDAWDLSPGAHDDGAGCVQAAEVLYLFKALGIRPKRTVRAVMFMNEENGGRGGEKYAELAKANSEKHIAAIESDAGAFSPRGFSFKGDSLAVEHLMRWRSIFTPYYSDRWFRGYGGADIDHLAKVFCPGEICPVLIGLSPDSQRYFDYHHAASDTFDKINRRELELGAAFMASMVYLLAEYGVK